MTGFERYLKASEFEQIDKTGMSIEEINKLYKEYTELEYYFPFNPYANDPERCESPFSHFSKEYEAFYKKMYKEGTLPNYCNMGEFWR